MSMRAAIVEVSPLCWAAQGITENDGKTSLLDAIRSRRRRIVFIDTSGHEAFTAMRARGSRVTDRVLPRRTGSTSPGRTLDVEPVARRLQG